MNACILNSTGWKRFDMIHYVPQIQAHQLKTGSITGNNAS